MTGLLQIDERLRDSPQFGGNGRRRGAPASPGTLLHGSGHVPHIFILERPLQPKAHRWRTATTLYRFLYQKMKQCIVSSGYRPAKANLLGIRRRWIGETAGKSQEIVSYAHSGVLSLSSSDLLRKLKYGIRSASSSLRSSNSASLTRPITSANLSS